MRIDVRGNEVKAYVDGKIRAFAAFPEIPPEGGIAFMMEDAHLVPSLSGPHGIDRVTITDLVSGEVLLDDRFDNLDPAAWKQLPPDSRIESGPFDFSRGELVSSGSWRDYRVDVKFRNITGATIFVRRSDRQTDVAYTFRPFRHLDNGLTLRQEGRPVQGYGGDGLQLSPPETLKSIAAVALGPYPYVLPFLLAALVLAAALCFLPAPSLDSLKLSPLLLWTPVVVIASLVFAITLYLNYVLGAHMPHVPDEVSFLFQAKLLAAGHLSAPVPVAEAFDFFYPPLIVASQGKWASVYPFGHPLVLALGVKVGAPWLIPPLLGAASVVALFVVARRVYTPAVALIACLLLATSPFFLMNASSFMSHNTAAFYILASLAFLAYRDRSPVAFGFASGLFFGLLFNTRPLTAFGLMPAFGLMLLTPLASRRFGFTLRNVGGFAVGGLVMLGAYLLYNLGTTGDVFKNGYQASADVSQVVGFGGRHTIEAGLQNERTQMAYLLLVFNGWPLYVGLMLAFLPFILGTRRVWDWFLLACTLSTFAVWTLYEGNGLMYGPRYWYEALPFLVLLSARGAQAGWQFIANTGERALGRLLHRPREWELPAALVTVVTLSVLMGWAVYGWLLGQRQDWHADAVPNTAAALRGFNGINDSLLKKAREDNLNNALVMVEPCSNWQCYGSVFWLNSPWLDNDVLFARDLGSKNGPTFAAYPDRLVYYAKYSPASLQPWDLSGENSGKPNPIPPPLAKDIAVPEPPAIPQEDTSALAPARDEQRRRDLEAMAGALNRYYAKYGQYPEAKYTQTFCGYAFDSACKVTEFLSPLPKDPENRPNYWYQSDGSSFLLFAGLEAPPGDSACTEPIPDHLAAVRNLICVRAAMGALR